MIAKMGSFLSKISTLFTALSMIFANSGMQAQYFKTSFSFDQTTNVLSFYIKPTGGSMSTDIGSFQFDVTYPLGSVINFGSVDNNTAVFPNLNVVETNLFTLNNEWVKRWEHHGLIPFQTYTLNQEYLVFSVVVTGSGTFNLSYKSDYSNFDPVFTVNSDDGTILWDINAPYDVYYPTQLQSGNIIYMNLSVTLPVELSHFDSKVIDKTVLLTWETKSETNLYGFEIERSYDGINFDKIDFQKSHGGSFLTSYSFEDKDKTLSSENYYRLKMVDFDGSFEYSNIAFAKIQDFEPNIAISPNPAGNQFQVYLNLVNDDFVTLDILDLQGKLIINKQANFLAGHYNWDINTDLLENGNYIVRLISSEQIVSKKITIIK